MLHVQTAMNICVGTKLERVRNLYEQVLLAALAKDAPQFVIG